MKVLIKFEKTSNPLFTEGKDLQGNMPTMPRTDSMFDHREAPKPAEKPDNDKLINGQKHTGHVQPNKTRVTQPGTTVNDTPMGLDIYFDSPGDFQPNRG